MPMALLLVTLSRGPGQRSGSTDIRPDPRPRATQESRSEEIKSKIREFLSIRPEAREAEQTAVASGKEITPTPPEPAPATKPTNRSTEAPTITPEITSTPIPARSQTPVSTEVPTTVPTAMPKEIPVEPTETPAEPTESPREPTTSPNPEPTPAETTRQENCATPNN